jgi:hypothetical protein
MLLGTTSKPLTLLELDDYILADFARRLNAKLDVKAA